MAVPITSAFPAPTGSFPLSPTLGNPAAGVSPYSTANYLTGAFQQNTLELLQNRQLEQQRLMQAAQFAAVNGSLGNPLDSNPNQWTPQEAAAQTDRALAKLSTVNPDLANQLAAQRTGGDSGGGFFDSLKQVAGELLHPALSVAGKVFDVVGRTAHIVPNVAYDIADGGSFDLGHDVGSALTGEVQRGWHDVLDQMVGHKTGLWGAALGVVGDIATDPLTWLFPAGAGKGIAEVAEQAGRFAGTAGVAKAVTSMSAAELEARGLGDIAKFVAGKSEAEVTKILETHYEALTKDIGDAAARVGMTTGEMQEKAMAAVNNTYKVGELDLYKQLWEVVNNTSMLVQSRGWKAAVRADQFLSDGLQVGAKDVRAMFEQTVKDGAWKFGPKGTPERALWDNARSFASLAGGLRFKVAVPYTNFRYISSPLWDTARFMPHAGGQAAMRFFAGESGMANLVHYIHKGDLGMDALQSWMNMGYREWAKEYPEAAKTLLTRTGRMGSMLYSASDRVGGLTAHFGAQARAARAGLVHMFAYRDAKDAEEQASSFFRGLVEKLQREDQSLPQRYEEHLGASVNPARHTMTEQMGQAVSEYMSYFPAEVDTSTPEAIDAWYRSVHPEFNILDAEAQASQGALSESEAQALQRHYNILEDMKKVAKGPSEDVAWTPAQVQILRDQETRFNTMREEATRHGASIGVTTQRLDEARELPLEQGGDWRHELGRQDGITEQKWYYTPTNAQSRQEARHGLGLTDSAVDYHDDLHSVGVEVHTVQKPGDVEVMLRAPLNTPIELGENGDALLPGGLVTENLPAKADRTVLQVKAEARDAVAAAARQADTISPLTRVADEEVDRKALEVTTDAMRVGRQGSTMVYQKQADGSLRAVVWDTENVKVVGKDLVPSVEGYYPRYINEKWSKWVNGEINKLDKQPLLSEPQIKAEIERGTRGMTMKEANAQARAILREKFPHANMDTLPDWAFITNPLEADKVYADRLATDIKAQVLGRAADRNVRLYRIAPFMYHAEPRGQLYELNMSKGWVKALTVNAGEVQAVATQLKKREAAYTEQQLKAGGRIAEGFGHLSLLVDDLSESLVIPDRVQILEARYGGTVEKARQYIAQAREAINARRAKLAEEQGLHDQARQEFLDGYKIPPTEEEAAAAKDALDAAVAATNDPLRVTVIPDEYTAKVKRVQELEAKAAKSPEQAASSGAASVETQPAALTAARAQREKLWQKAQDAAHALDTTDPADARATDKAFNAVEKADADLAKAEENLRKLQDLYDAQQDAIRKAATAAPDVAKVETAYEAAAKKVRDLEEKISNAEDDGRDTSALEEKLAEAEDSLAGATDALNAAGGKALTEKLPSEVYQVQPTPPDVFVEGMTKPYEIVTKNAPGLPGGQHLRGFDTQAEAEAELKRMDDKAISRAVSKTEGARAAVQAKGGLTKAEQAELAKAKADIAELEAQGLGRPELKPGAPGVEQVPGFDNIYVYRVPEYPAGSAGAEAVAHGELPSGKLDVYFAVDENGRTVGYRDVKADGKVDTKVHPLSRRQGFGSSMLRAHWTQEGVYQGTVEQRLAAARSLIERQHFTSEGAALNEAELKRIAQESAGSPATPAIWDREVELGNIHYNKNTRSVFTHEGNLVKQGGGVRVQSDFSRQQELEALRGDMSEFDRAEASMAEGRYYEAPGPAQAGGGPLPKGLRVVETTATRGEMKGETYFHFADAGDNWYGEPGQKANSLWFRSREDAERYLRENGARAPGEQRTLAQRATYTSQEAQHRYQLAAREHSNQSAKAVAVGKTLGRIRTQLNASMNELNKLYAESKGIKADIKVALEKIDTAGDLGGRTRLRVPGLEGYAMPTLIAEEWHAAIDKFGPSDLRKEWRNWVLGPWKRWATYRNPGFHVRNFYGAWFNNWLGGVREFHFNFSFRVNKGLETAVSDREFSAFNLGRLFGEDARGSLTYAQVKEHLAGMGIGSANTRSVLEAADTVNVFQDGLDLANKSWKHARKAFGYVDGKMRDIGGSVESFHRVAAWARGMEVAQGDTWGARAFTMMRHGDYAELTNAEDHIRDIIPFYKWLRTNTPYQIRMLAENPGQLALVTRAREFAYDAQGLDQQKAETGQPDFMRQTLSIPIPDWVPLIGSKGPDHLKYAMIDMPYNDLYNGLNDYISAALPVVRNLVESYGFHEQAFTGKPLAGRMVPLSGAFNIPGVRDVLAAVGLAHKGADGGIYINDRVENVLTGFPVYSRFRNFVEADPDRVQQRLGGLVSFMTGVGVRESDATQAELDFYYNELEPVLQQYRDMGVVFPNAQDFVNGAEAVSPKLPAYTLPQQIGPTTTGGK